MKSRLMELLDGLWSNLQFSNRFQLIYDRIFRRKSRLSHYIWKNRLFFICNTGLGDHIAVQECFCKRIYDVFLDQCQFPANRVAYVNVGANIGAFDLLFLDRNVSVEFGLAVELNPLTFSRCLVNLQTNRLFSTQLVNAGIAGTNRFVTFQNCALSLSDSIFTPVVAQMSDTINSSRVELLTLETLLEKYGVRLEQYDLLKLDCEQAEYEIIRLSPSAVLRKFRYIIVEFHPEPEGESISAAYAKLSAVGFSSGQSGTGKLPFTDIFIRS